MNKNNRKENQGTIFTSMKENKADIPSFKKKLREEREVFSLTPDQPFLNYPNEIFDLGDGYSLYIDVYNTSSVKSKQLGNKGEFKESFPMLHLKKLNNKNPEKSWIQLIPIRLCGPFAKAFTLLNEQIIKNREEYRNSLEKPQMKPLPHRRVEQLILETKEEDRENEIDKVKTHKRNKISAFPVVNKGKKKIKISDEEDEFSDENELQ